VKETPIYEERVLLAHVAKGDENAFQILFTQYRHKIFYFAWKLLQSESLAEDVLQEIFLKIWIHREKLPEVLHFKTYLTTITRNYIYNALRKRANEEKYLKGVALHSAIPRENPALDTISLHELQHTLQKAVDTLTPQQKKVFELRRLEGFKYEEIAALMNISKETVKTHIKDALRTIREQLKSHEKLAQLGILLFLTHL
jgi:RNA polymerase sigma-70 factor (ECF subfamily)